MYTPFLLYLICSPSIILLNMVFSFVFVPVNITVIFVSIIYILPSSETYNNLRSPSALSVTVKCLRIFGIIDPSCSGAILSNCSVNDEGPMKSDENTLRT